MKATSELEKTKPAEAVTNVTLYGVYPTKILEHSKMLSHSGKVGDIMTLVVFVLFFFFFLSEG